MSVVSLDLLPAVGIGASLMGSGGVLTWAAQRARKSSDTPIEHPKRVTNFIASLEARTWAPGDIPASMEAVAKAATTLFQAEIDYYYGLRIGRRSAAGAFRTAAYISGSLGLLCPLVEAAWPASMGLAKWGYVLLAVAASMFAGNQLFGGTDGHVRAVKAQYEIERLVNGFFLDWQEWRVRYLTAPDGTLVTQGFTLVRSLMIAVYTVIQEETGEWGEALADAEASAARSMRLHAAGQDKVSSKAKPKPDPSRKSSKASAAP
ncbi:SLATT domain-containing protein [Sphingomonas sp. KR3-1]|uniref:SLATT domain-containing protein n=1 Tax=Sphingomonas sp. KR3-1 TaxID=3156611 RepID=UPI0032B39808